MQYKVMHLRNVTKKQLDDICATQGTVVVNIHTGRLDEDVVGCKERCKGVAVV